MTSLMTIKNTLCGILHWIFFSFFIERNAAKPHNTVFLRLPCWPWHGWASRTWPARLRPSSPGVDQRCASRADYPAWWTNSLPWKITIFNGKIHYFDWAIFNSYVNVYQRVCLWIRNSQTGFSLLTLLSLCPCALFLLSRNSKWFSAVYLSVVQIYLSQK